ncbi:MAG: elongation factor P maturation arginine rhamnosyltransferase EarP [Pseudomonadota bacterium]
MHFESPSPAAIPSITLALFCKVVDNFGDIGICWRLARQLQHEHGVAVSLWVDHMPSFQRLCPQLDVGAELQQLEGVCVRHWQDQEGVFSAQDVADIVIEFFACDIPPGYIEAMARRSVRPVWLNLEGLSAEPWVEGCHRLPSTHPRLPLLKHFFFPGFNERTGGLLCEAALAAQRRQFQGEPGAAAAFLARLGVAGAHLQDDKVSLFCYPHAPLAALFEAWQALPRPLLCLVPEGVASAQVQHFLGAPATAGAVATRAALTVQVLPFLPQSDYDKLLWSCDFNFVRGEDSFVRAQWAGAPFVWHIYPQDENLHHVKLRAFLQHYAPDLPALRTFSLHWNVALATAPDWTQLWAALQAEQGAQLVRARAWEQQMRGHGDLASNLMRFAASLRLAAAEKQGIMPG